VGLRADEVRGQNFFNLDIGLPTDQLAREHARLPHGRRFASRRCSCRRRTAAATRSRTASPLVGGNKEVHGVILLMEQSTPARVN